MQDYLYVMQDYCHFLHNHYIRNYIDGSPPEKKELFGSDFNEENSESGSDVEGTGISLFTGQSAVKTTSKAKKKKKKKKQKIKSKVELQRQEVHACTLCNT